MFNIKIDIDENKLVKRFYSNVDDANKAMATSAFNGVTMYEPKRSGKLSDSKVLINRGDSYDIEYRVPYGRKQYYTDNNKSTKFHPYATSRWFEVWKMAHIRNVIDVVTALVRAKNYR